ncbi:MAG: group II truncated hemoglobin [Pseudomonadota bacterium]
MTKMTPFDMVGGETAVRAIVDRFYDLMDEEPGYAELRALHGPDLDPMRASLSGFLTAWLGGPRDWFVDNPGKCVMSLHGAIAVTAQTAQQWAEAMQQAIVEFGTEQGLEPDFLRQMGDALRNMASAMIRRERVPA